MSVLKKKKMSILVFIVLPLLMLGCSSKNDESISVAEELQINQGAILKYEEDKYNLYDYKKDEYELYEPNKAVVAYDKSSSNYIYSEDKKYYIVHNGEKNEVKDKEFTDIKISPNGKYISYFIEDEGLHLKVFETGKNKEMKIDSKVSISGVLYDWYDENIILYYGVSNDGVNGIFTYDLNNNKEDLIYKIDEGFLGFMKSSKENIIFLQIDFDNNKELMILNKYNNEVVLLTDKVELLQDIVIKNNEIYFVGKAYNDKESLYRINENKVQRLVFDFPSMVEADKGLSVDENGEILFIGKDDSSKNKAVYSCSEDKTISLVSDKASDYNFIRINE
ncbi:hypothetical protein JW813_11690 [Clostridium botulinum]|uniref:hypothetical protein n=1 Tax=Clostridium botulinum TaxID=1491 RepID=UPI0013F0DCB9|nr:hypothetical protein [Clostridium botulinum]NFG23323.1 hypothetical protein [Clostridium botulinum]NFO03225.1 hypothetical protein [Clostridium botulinum]NFR14616.1 hypothetical protein [Clostridium botulinum]NFR42279.1 hypothetical protein [Clostridium botulinum]NFS50153.1 hypothetical protein [Clostridium botulinum]